MLTQQFRQLQQISQSSALPLMAKERAEGGWQMPKLPFIAGLVAIIGASIPAAADTQWRSANFPPPNGGVLVYKITSSGNPACASYNGHDCLWGLRPNQINFNQVRPLTCGSNHRAVWGTTGYEDRRHWCQLAKHVAIMD